MAVDEFQTHPMLETRESLHIYIYSKKAKQQRFEKCQMHQEKSLQSHWPFVVWNVLLILKSLCCIPNGGKNRNPSGLINTALSPLEIILFVKSKPDSLGRLIMIQEQPRPSEHFSRGEPVYVAALKPGDTSGARVPMLCLKLSNGDDSAMQLS